MKQVTISITGSDKELNFAILNILSSKIHGLNLELETIKTDSTIHMSELVIKKKQEQNNVRVVMDINNE